MEVVREIKKDRRAVIMVITGNGGAEFRRLKTFAHRYNGKIVLWFPLSPMSKKRMGLSALKALNIYPGKHKITSFLFVVDREYFKSEPQREIEKFLRGERIDIKSVEKIDGEALCILCKVGPYEMSVYTAILGEEKYSEEELAKLIKLELKSEVEADKKSLKRFFRNRNMREEDLIEEARDENLHKAFPSLNSALTEIKGREG